MNVMMAVIHAQIMQHALTLMQVICACAKLVSLEMATTALVSISIIVNEMPQIFATFCSI